jgi:hypothetical protein
VTFVTEERNIDRHQHPVVHALRVRNPE